MSRLTIPKLQKDYTRLRDLSANTPVSIKPGKYDRESSFVFRVCELQDIADKMRAKLAQIAASYGFGDEYQEICGMLAEHNEYAQKALEYSSQGGDWRDKYTPRAEKPRKEKAPAPDVGTGVFGRTWDEIEKMQGGKLTR